MRLPILPVHPRLLDSRSNVLDTQVTHTGRYMIVLRPGEIEAGIALLRKEGFKVADSRDSGTEIVRETDMPDVDIIVYARTGIALLSGEDDQLERVSGMISGSGPIVAVNPEGITVPSDLPRSSQRELALLRGYHAAVSSFLDQNTENSQSVLDATVDWVVGITGAATSKFTGSGVKIGFADTGLDLGHPDFQGRVVAAASAVPNANAQDFVGHGTHCTGVACGPMNPASVPRYGISPNSQIVVVKVMTDASVGAQGWVVSGCEWAVANGCRIICLAIQEPVSPGQGFDVTYEQLGRFCLTSNTLLIAAAGNDSDRGLGSIRPVSAPANCPSIMAVGAAGFANGNVFIANFSNAGGVNGAGSDVDLVAPGVSVPSALPMPTAYGVISGTSQAAAVVAGVAALGLQMHPELNALGLWRALQGTARKLSFPTSDAGAGFVLAPQ
jgi:subtilisin family serine protease